MGPMMMMMAMNGNKKTESDSSMQMMEALRKQNELIMNMNSQGFRGDSKDSENSALMSRLNELESKLATKFSKSGGSGGGM